MFELAANCLTTAPFLPALQNLAPASTGATNAEIAADGGAVPQVKMFEAMLALQTAPATIVPTSSAPALPVRQEGGKVLPDAATAVAVDAAPDDSSTPEDLSSADDIPTVAPTPPPLPDLALIAAILAAPQRLEPAGDSATPPTTAPRAQPVAASAPVAVPATPSVAAAISLARTAKIELEVTPTPLAQVAPRAPAESDAATMPQVAATVSAIAHPITPPRAKPSAPADAAPAAPQADAAVFASVTAHDPDDALPVEVPADAASPLFQTAAPATPQQDAAPATRAEPRAERIDFATLVETLSRAREEASPNAVRASVHHADFGRISLRFEQDDKGALSVAMNSPDPGFARAVTASSEAAAPQTQADTQRGQSSQNQTSAQGESPRQQPGARRSHPAPQPRDTLRRDEPQAESGNIFA